MANLEEEIKYEEGILRLDTQMPVKGYDGKTLGVANTQGLQLANRTAWLKKKLKELEDREYVISVNKKNGVVTLTYTDVGAAPNVHKHEPTDIKTSEKYQFISKENRETWNAKQEKLVSGTNIKTINKTSVLGSGDVSITPEGIGAAKKEHKHGVADIVTTTEKQFVSDKEKTTWSGKQDKLVSGTNIKTINKVSVLGNGDISITPEGIGAATKSHKHPVSDIETTTEKQFVSSTEKSTWSAKQEKLVSAKNIKTINSVSILGEGNISMKPADIGAATKEHKHDPKDINTSADNRFVTDVEKQKWSGKQDELVSGKNLRTINKMDLLGDGDVQITPGGIGAAEKSHMHSPNDVNVTNDKQFVSLTEKGTWSAKQDKLIGGGNIKTILGKNVLGSGNMTITSTEVGADEKGTAANLLARHNSESDPHDQYLNTERGNKLYVTKETANKANGYLKLNEKGQLPADIAQLYEVRYLVVPNQAKRLAVGNSLNTTICLQSDENRIYYLDGEKDASKNNNWVQGRSTDVSSVVSVFGRAGIVKQETGDYNADQITETSTRKFVTPTEKSTWGGKQDKLVSGKNIATVFGKPLLSSANITLADVTNLEQIIYELFAAKEGMAIAIDPSTKKIVFKTDLVDGNADAFSMKEVAKAVAKQVYEYTIGSNISYSFNAYALKKKSIYESSSTTQIFNETTVKAMEGTTYPSFNSAGYPILAEHVEIAVNTAEGNFVKSAAIDITDALQLSFALDNTKVSSILPTFKADGKLNGFTPIASSVYSDYKPWLVFADPLNDENIKEVAKSNYWSDGSYFSEGTTESWVGITSDVPVLISAYSFQTFDKFYWSTSGHPSSWSLQGRNADSESWVTIDTRSNETMKGSGEWKTYRLAKDVSYKQYRILIKSITASGSARASVARMDLRSSPYMLLKGDDGKYYTVRDNKFVAVSLPTKEAFDSVAFKSIDGFVNTTGIEHLKSVNIITKDSLVMHYSMYGKTQHIVINRKTTDSTQLQTIKKIDYVIDVSGDEDRIKMALTPDGVKWYTLDSNNQWYDLGTLSGTASYAKVLIEKGMKVKTVKTISKTKLEELLAKSTGTKQIGVAFGSEINFRSTKRVAEKVIVYYDELNEWVKQSESEVKISLYNKAIRFTPTEAGEYKFFYKFD